MQSAAAAHSLGHPLHPQVCHSSIQSFFLLVFNMHYRFFFLLSSQVDNDAPQHGQHPQAAMRKYQCKMCPQVINQNVLHEICQNAPINKKGRNSILELQKIALQKGQKLQSFKILGPHRVAAVTPNVCPSRFMRK